MDSLKNSPLHLVRMLGGAARKLGSGAFVDQGIISGLNFLTFLVLARWLASDTFGAYVLAFSALMFFQTFQHALVTRAHNVLGARRAGNDFLSFTRTALALVAGGAVVGAGVLAIIAFSFHLLGWEAWAGATAGLAVVLFPWLVQDAMRRFLYTADRITAATINDAVSYVLQFGGIAALFWLDISGSVFLVFGVLGASSLAAVCVGLFQLEREVWSIPDRKSFLDDSRAVWDYGKWLSSGELVGWIGQNGNTWLIGGLLGAPLVAGYRAASYVTNLLNPIDLAVSNYLPVQASRVLDTEGRKGMIRWLTRRGLILSIPYALLATGITLFAFEMLDLFYDDRYVTDLLALVLVITVWARFGGFVVNFLRLGLMVSERTIPVFVSQVIGLVIFAVLSTVLISTMGIVGAPLGRIALHIVVGGYLLRQLMQDSRPANIEKSVPDRSFPASMLSSTEATQ